MKNKIYIFTLIIAILSLYSCDEPGADIIYNGPKVVELKDVGTASPDLSFFPVDDEMIPGRFIIQAVGPIDNNSYTFNFEVDTERSTGIEGVHFSFPSKTVTIPAGALSAQIPFMVLRDGFDFEAGGGSGETRSLVIRLVDGDLPISVNYASAVALMTAVNFCPYPSVVQSDWTGSYSSVVNSTFGAPINRASSASIVVVNDTLRINNFWGNNSATLNQAKFVINPSPDGPNQATLIVPPQITEGWTFGGDAGLFAITRCTGTYDNCKRTLTISGDVVQKGPFLASAPNFDTAGPTSLSFTIVFTKN